MSIRERTLPQLLHASTERYGGLIAIEDGEVRLTFRDLARAAEQAARACCAAGIRTGDRVAIWAPNIHEWIFAALGLQCVGGILVPLNTRLKGSEAGYILAKSGARLLFTVGEFLGNHYVDYLRSALGGPEAGRPVTGLPTLERIVLLRGEQDDSLPWDEFLHLGRSVSVDTVRQRFAAVAPEDLLDILFTSGTTGKPKA